LSFFLFSLLHRYSVLSVMAALCTKKSEWKRGQKRKCRSPARTVFLTCDIQKMIWIALPSARPFCENVIVCNESTNVFYAL
jgi:hypothetical protein